MVSVSIGHFTKQIAVLGRRRVFWRRDGTPQFSNPEPVESVPLLYQLAYGGLDPRVPVSGLMMGWMYRWIFAGMDREFDRHNEYFTPRLTYADRQLQALSARIGADYKRGALDWPSFAGRGALAIAPDIPPSSGGAAARWYARRLTG